MTNICNYLLLQINWNWHGFLLHTERTLTWPFVIMFPITSKYLYINYFFLSIQLILSACATDQFFYTTEHTCIINNFQHNCLKWISVYNNNINHFHLYGMQHEKYSQYWYTHKQLKSVVSYTGLCGGHSALPSIKLGQVQHLGKFLPDSGRLWARNLVILSKFLNKIDSALKFQNFASRLHRTLFYKVLQLLEWWIFIVSLWQSIRRRNLTTEGPDHCFVFCFVFIIIFISWWKKKKERDISFDPNYQV